MKIIDSEEEDDDDIKIDDSGDIFKPGIVQLH